MTKKNTTFVPSAFAALLGLSCALSAAAQPVATEPTVTASPTGSATPATVEIARATPIRELAGTGWSSQDLVEALTLAAPAPRVPRLRGHAPAPRCDDYWTLKTRGGSASAFQAVAIQILFEFDSAKLTEEAQRDLTKIAEALESDRLQPCCFEIQGHTDSVGSGGYNLDLSERRAQAVVEFLASRLGIEATRLIPVGYGEEEPLSTNATDEGRQRNRRVQIANLGYGRIELD